LKIADDVEKEEMKKVEKEETYFGKTTDGG